MNLRPPFLTVLLASFLCVGVSGCLNLKPVEDPIRYFLLSPMDLPEEAVTRGSNDLSLGVEPVIVAPYLNRPWLVQRTSETEIRYSDFYKWGEYLDRGIQRAMIDNLSRLLGTDRIHISTWRKEAVDVELRLVVLRFDVDREGQVTLEAQWTVEGATSVAGHRVIVMRGPDPARDPAGAVKAMSTALGELSMAIAGDIQPR